MASFRVMTKNGWKGPFPEAALITKYRQGGIPDGTRIQDSTTGGEMAIEDLVADATVILQKSAYDKPVSTAPAKLSPAEARAATQKLPENRPKRASGPVAKPAAKSASVPAVPAQPAAARVSTRAPVPKLPTRPGGLTRAAAVAPPAVKARGLNVVFLLGCLVLLGGIGGPFLSFEHGAADGGAMLLFGYDLPLRLTAGAEEFAWQPSAPLAWAFHALFLVYLVPLVVLIVLADELLGRGKGRNRWYARLATGLIAPACAAAIGALFFSAQAAGIAGDDAIPRTMREAGSYADFLRATFEAGRGYFSAGPWALAAGSVLCLVSVFTSPRPKASAPPGSPNA
ncbi:MAG: hypothetical protein HS108_01170 [Planctomycetes bacterium]|jgi:hypothetical protein|nr:hypothetical protein [Planctomycetota bacterium]MCL4730860.1 hypothetical protein [Planctomycetota bacterium]